MADSIEKPHRYRHRHHSRSRSPKREHSHSHRTRSPHGNHHRNHRPNPVTAPVELPYNSRNLTKHDYGAFKPMFSLYLDIQKQKILEDMDEVEAKGRWKSFIGKWNRGELSDGWYDPTTFQKAVAAAGVAREDEPRQETKGFPSEIKREREEPRREESRSEDAENDSDESMGPALPGQESRSRRSRVGPSIPNIQDLELKREMEQEDAQRDATSRREDLKYERSEDRKAQKAVLDELVPRAEPGTRARQLEKKALVNEKMKSFRERSPGAVEVPESELMGGGDSLTEFKQKKQEFERKKNEREIRKEEILRARAEERDERLREYRDKEDKTMAILKALAKNRFGGS